MDGFSLLKTIHLLSAVFWIGGMGFAYLVLRPSLAVLEPPQRIALHTQVFRRFFLIIWHAMPLMLLTGFGMLFGYYGGMSDVDRSIHIMMLLGLIMAAVFVAIFFGPYRRFRGSDDRAVKVAALDSIRKLIAVNLVLGVVTIVVAMLG